MIHILGKTRFLLPALLMWSGVAVAQQIVFTHPGDAGGFSGVVAPAGDAAKIGGARPEGREHAGQIRRGRPEARDGVVAQQICRRRGAGLRSAQLDGTDLGQAPRPGARRAQDVGGR